MLKIIALLLIILIISLLIEDYRELHRFEIKTYELQSTKLNADTSINFIFISDLHNYSYGTDNEYLLQAVTSLNPDIIFIGGDMITRSDPASYDKTFPVLKSLSEIAPVYFSPGNHEQKLKLFPEKYQLSYNDLSNYLKECGITLLENNTVHTTVANSSISITGLEIPIAGYSYLGNNKISYKEIEDCIGLAREEKAFRILLAHNPMHMNLYKKWKPDLILSGHLHGGIVRIPYLGGLIAPDFIPFPKYSGGLFQEDSLSIIVSNGLGVHSIPIRINCPAQLIQINLKGKLL